MKIKELPNVDRPREKILKYGSDKLADFELLAILLGSGTKKLNVLELSKRIIKQYGSKGLLSVSKGDLLKISGIGPAKVGTILAAIEFGKRITEERNAPALTDPWDVWREVGDVRKLKKEHLVCFYLNSRHRVISREVISMGTVDMSLFHPREIFEPAIKK